MHALHLLGTIDHRRKADAAFAHRLIKLRVGSTGHDVGADRKSGEGLVYDGLNLAERSSVYIDCRGVVVRVDDLGLKSVLFRDLADDLKAFLFALMRNEAHVRADRCLLRQNVACVRA